ncbi:BTB/POZ domain-containing protein At3g19850 [Linum perenne]
MIILLSVCSFMLISLFLYIPLYTFKHNAALKEEAPPMASSSSSSSSSHLPSHLAIHVNSKETFFLNEKLACFYFGKLRKMIRKEKRRTQIKITGIQIDGFPGGPSGFEQVAGFCYNGGRVNLSAANVSLLHCSAVFLGMTETASSGGNLLKQTEEFLDGIIHWPLADIVTCLKTCEDFFHYADSVGLVQKLVSGVLVRISDRRLSWDSRSSSDSSSRAAEWWFDELVGLSPVVIEMIVKKLGAFGCENSSLMLTRFILHYLKKRVSRTSNSDQPLRISTSRSKLGLIPESNLADTAIHGVISASRNAFSYRGLLRVLRIVSGFRPTKGLKDELERLIGELLDEASLDDLLICGVNNGGGRAGVYDVDLVIRLVRIFVRSHEINRKKMRKVVRLVDKYMREISPDHNLQMNKFLEVAESLPKSARDCFDAVYRAIDIYLESHPTLSFEERSRICRCLDFERLSMEACKEIAKNPKIPPSVAVQALMSKRSSKHNHHSTNEPLPHRRDLHKVEARHKSKIIESTTPRRVKNNGEVSLADFDTQLHKYSCSPAVKGRTTPGRVSVSNLREDEDVEKSVVRMQKKVVELERACREMKNQMSKMAKDDGDHQDGSNGIKLMSINFRFGKNMGRICY